LTAYLFFPILVRALNYISKSARDITGNSFNRMVTDVTRTPVSNLFTEYFKIYPYNANRELKTYLVIKLSLSKLH